MALMKKRKRIIIILVIVTLLLLIPSSIFLYINRIRPEENFFISVILKERKESQYKGYIKIISAYKCYKDYGKFKSILETEDNELYDNGTNYIYHSVVVKEKKDELCSRLFKLSGNNFVWRTDEEIKQCEDELAKEITEITNYNDEIDSQISKVKNTCELDSKKITKEGLKRINKNIN